MSIKPPIRPSTSTAVSGRSGASAGLQSASVAAVIVELGYADPAVAVVIGAAWGFVCGAVGKWARDQQHIGASGIRGLIYALLGALN